MASPRQSWGVGDVFLAPLEDGRNVVGQIVGQERQVLNSASCAFFDIILDEPDPEELSSSIINDRVFSVLFVTRELLDSGLWKVIGNRPVVLEPEQLPYERLRSTGFVGAKVIGAGIVRKFLNAFCGLHPWDAWHDPDYLDKLLVSADKKPRQLVLSKRTDPGAQ